MFKRKHGKFSRDNQPKWLFKKFVKQLSDKIKILLSIIQKVLKNNIEKILLILIFGWAFAYCLAAKVLIFQRKAVFTVCDQSCKNTAKQ